MNLLGEGSVAYAGIDEGLSHTRHLNDLRQEEEVRRSTKKKYAVWSFVERPTKKPSVCRVLDFCLFQRLDMRLIYELY